MLNTVNPIMTGIRMIFMSFDLGIYYLLKLMYELFFNIATFNILDREMIFDLFSRIQLVVGIFMMFRLVMIIINGIVNPDTVSDSKTGGAGSMVMRIIVSLVLLALIVPINIPSPRNEYERQINNSGLLFGTLYSLQYRVLTNNTIGRIILNDKNTNYTSNTPDSQGLSMFANKFTSTIVKTFYTLNTDEDGNYVCGDGWDEEFYNQDDVDPMGIITFGVRQCNENIITGATKPLNIGGQYSLSMTYVISTIAGIVMVILMFMMTFEVAKRVFQLAALQLLAPIPIISYMDPKGSKDGAFQSWLKLLGTTYADLFVRLAVIYFAFGIISSFIERFFTKSFSLTEGAEYVGNAINGDVLNAPIILSWTFIIMVIALFIFAKDAPKFLKQMLGIKSDGKFFSAFGSAMGLGVAAAGAIGSFNASRQANFDADSANAKIRARQRKYQDAFNKAKAQGLSDSDAAVTANKAADAWVGKYGDRYASMFGHSAGNRAKNVAAGLFGAGAGLITGSAAASESKGNAWAKMMASANAVNKRNANVRSAGRDGGGFLSAISSKGDEMIHGQNAYDRLEAQLKAEEQKIKNDQTSLKTRQDALKDAQNTNAHNKAAMDRWNSKGIDTDKTVGSYTYTVKDAWGKTVMVQDANTGQMVAKTITITGNARDFDSKYTAANDNGEGVIFEYQTKDAQGNVTTITQAQYDAIQDPNKTDKYKKMSYFEYGGEKVYMGSAKDIHKGIVEANGYDYYNKTVKFEEATNAFMAANPGLDIRDARARVEQLANDGNLVTELVNLGMQQDVADGYSSVIRDNDILGHRDAYREAMIAHHMSADHMSRREAEQQADINMRSLAKEVKAAYGDANIANSTMADELARESQELSARSQYVNEQRQNVESQKHKADATYFNNGGGKS